MAGQPLRQRALKYAALLGALHLVLKARTSRQATLPSSASSDSTTSQERPARPMSELGAVVLKYVALAAAAGALLFAMKILLFTGMNGQVAAALVANTSASTAIQMLLAVTPEIGFVLGLVAVYQAGRLSKRGNPENDPFSWMLMIPLFVTAVALFAPAVAKYDVWVLIIPAIASVQAFLGGRSRFGTNYPRITVGIIALLVLQFLVSGDMWLPKEYVQVAGSDYLVYVTSESDDSLTAYFPANKAVLRLEKSKVDQRQYCGPKDATPTLGSQWKGIPALPECPPDDGSFPVGNGVHGSFGHKNVT